jgi:hypothetical protein
LALQLSSQVNRHGPPPEESRAGPINYSKADALDFLPDVAEIPPRCTGSRFTFHFANYALTVGTSLAVNE